MKIVEAFLTKSPYYAANQNPTDYRYANYQKNGPKGAMLHSVGCPQPKAMVFVNAWNKSTYTAASVHGFIDANDGVIYQTLPWGYRAPHAGGNANNTHIGIEMCEPDCIKYTGGSSFTWSDKTRAIEMTKRTYEAAVELFAMLCKKYGWDPLEDGVIISHKEGNARGIASAHGDPEHLWRGLGLSYTMNTFRKDVKAKMNGSVAIETPEQPKQEQQKPAASGATIYRVQSGAFSSKEKATEQLKKVITAGFDAIIVLVDGLYKVQIGAFGEKKNAENMLVKVKAAGFEAFITAKNGQVVSSGASGYTLEQFIRDVQKVTGATVDGEAGKETLSKTVTLSINQNQTHTLVKLVQKRLEELDYDCGVIDGIFGAQTRAAVIQFQRNNKCTADGEITRGQLTWKKLLGMA